MSTIQEDIESTLAQSEPGVEVLLAEVLGGHTLRLFIDHPDGVTLALCERVTHLLPAVRERYSLEVSSPGTDRPLVKPEHFQRFLGRRARVRLAEPRGHRQPEAGGRSQKTLTGELVAATDDDVTLAAADGIVSVPYSDILRSNLVPGE